MVEIRVTYKNPSELWCGTLCACNTHTVKQMQVWHIVDPITSQHVCLPVAKRVCKRATAADASWDLCAVTHGCAQSCDTMWMCSRAAELGMSNQGLCYSFICSEYSTSCIHVVLRHIYLASRIILILSLFQPDCRSRQSPAQKPAQKQATDNHNQVIYSE